jgi:hypothetical protein
MSGLPAASPVELLHWPAEADRRAALGRQGVPCLVLVAPHADLPASIGPAEDWVRLPASEADVAARAHALCRRLARAAAVGPTIVDGLLSYDGLGVHLGVAEATALETLLGADGIVSRSDLTVALWPAGPPSRRSLDALIYRLRQRAAAVNVHVLAVRGRGFVVDVGPIAAHRSGGAA